jgi:hypothetical protein
MSFTVLLLLLFALLVYWLMTQILPERRKFSLLRPGLSEGLLESINERRHEMGLPLLELDPDLMLVAEEKAVHQILTGISDEGWEYPDVYADMFGQSLLMEALFTGPVSAIAEQMSRQRDLFDGEWICCGIGAAFGESGESAVALILCREPWEPVAEVAQRRSLLRSLVFRD